MDFTREPIIETIITPKDGCKLVVRNSKSAGQEEYFIDALEMVSFGHSLFFRSLERPKAFLVPVSDYEVLEVREARMVLKNVGPDRSIKIGGGREAMVRAPREERVEVSSVEEALSLSEQEIQPAEALAVEARSSEVKIDKKRDRRRHYRKRRGSREEPLGEEAASEVVISPLNKEKVHIPSLEEEAPSPAMPSSSNLLSSLLQPPSELISDTIRRYRKDEWFKGAFYLTEEGQYKPHGKVEQLLNEDEEESSPLVLQEPTYEPTKEEAYSFDQPFQQDQETFQEDISSIEALQKESSLLEEPFSDLAEVVFEEKEEEKENHVLGTEDFQEEASLPLYAEEEEAFIKERDLLRTEELPPPEKPNNHERRKKRPREDLPF